MLFLHSLPLIIFTLKYLAQNIRGWRVTFGSTIHNYKKSLIYKSTLFCSLDKNLGKRHKMTNNFRIKNIYTCILLICSKAQYFFSVDEVYVYNVLPTGCGRNNPPLGKLIKTKPSNRKFLFLLSKKKYNTI